MKIDSPAPAHEQAVTHAPAYAIKLA